MEYVYEACQLKQRFYEKKSLPVQVCEPAGIFIQAANDIRLFSGILRQAMAGRSVSRGRQP